VRERERETHTDRPASDRTEGVSCIAFNPLIKTAQQRTIMQRYGDWYTGGLLHLMVHRGRAWAGCGIIGQCTNFTLPYSMWHYIYGRSLSVSGRPCYILPMFFYLFIFLWPIYSPALVNGGSRKFLHVVDLECH